MTALEAFIAGRDTEELRATIRLCHRAIEGRRRLGWMQAPWDATWWHLTGGHGGTSPEPLVLAALCVAMGEELVRREASTLVCAACRHALGIDAVPLVTADGTVAPVAGSDVVSGGGR
jgi:hypothetical protein